MKNYLLLSVLLIFITMQSFSQDVNLYLINENIETVVSNNQRIVNDPFIMDNYMDSPGIRETSKLLDIEEDVEEREPEEKASRLGNFNMKIETVLSPTSKFLRLPLSYEFENLTLSMSIPYYYQRAMEYSHGKLSTRGFGDLSFNVAYNITGDSYSTIFTFHTKLATGDANKQVDGYLVPLGTGTNDFMFSNEILYNIGDLNIYNNLSYRISGSHTQMAEIYYPDLDNTEFIEYDIRNGNTTMLNTVFSYPIGWGVVLIGGFSAIYNTEGNMDKHHSYSNESPDKELLNLSARQDFLFVNANAGVSINILDTDIILNLMPPVFTQRSESNSEAARKLMFFARLTRDIF